MQISKQKQQNNERQEQTEGIGNGGALFIINNSFRFYKVCLKKKSNLMVFFLFTSASQHQLANFEGFQQQNSMNNTKAFQ